MIKLEEKLDELLVKKAPFQLPVSSKEGLVKAMPWLTLVGGILMLLIALMVWQWLGSLTSDVINVANQLNSYYGLDYTPISGMQPFLWLSLILIIVEAVMFFMAYPALKARQKRGWKLLFWVSLLNTAEAILQAIGYTNFGTLILALLGSVVGLYLLFQIRSYYTGESKPVSTGTMQTPKETTSTTPPPSTEAK